MVKKLLLWAYGLICKHPKLRLIETNYQEGTDMVECLRCTRWFKVYFGTEYAKLRKEGKLP